MTNQEKLSPRVSSTAQDSTSWRASAGANHSVHTGERQRTESGHDAVTPRRYPDRNSKRKVTGEPAAVTNATKKKRLLQPKVKETTKPPPCNSPNPHRKKAATANVTTTGHDIGRSESSLPLSARLQIQNASTSNVLDPLPFASCYEFEDPEAASRECRRILDELDALEEKMAEIRRASDAYHERRLCMFRDMQELASDFDQLELSTANPDSNEALLTHLMAAGPNCRALQEHAAVQFDASRFLAFKKRWSDFVRQFEDSAEETRDLKKDYQKAMNEYRRVERKMTASDSLEAFSTKLVMRIDRAEHRRRTADLINLSREKNLRPTTRVVAWLAGVQVCTERPGDR